MNTPPERNRLIVVSNRLPYVVRQTDTGNWEAQAGSGGLISALTPTLRKDGGVWVGWPGAADAGDGEVARLLNELTEDSGYSLKPVNLTQEEVDNFYIGFSNEVVWPLFHDLLAYCNFNPDFWSFYRHVNDKYAAAVADFAGPDDVIWIHDYHLMLVADALRQRKLTNRIGFFLHIPFPPLDVFLKLPWRFEIISGLLQFDTLGFQTLRDRRNFLECIHYLFDIDSTETKRQAVTIQSNHHKTPARLNGAGELDHEVRIGSFPIGIDYQRYADTAASKEVDKLATYLRSEMGYRKLILSIDRLDYTKGIVQRLEAFALLLKRHPELMLQVTLVQHVIPSREQIRKYRALKKEIERLVSEINGEFTQAGWAPVHYIHRSMSLDLLVAYYRAADIAIVNSLKDGMNLVAKEYCAAQVNNNGVLILSEFAGASAQLQEGAILVNPFDIEGVADAMHRALEMPEKEIYSRMRGLRQCVRRSNVFDWARSNLHVLMDDDLNDLSTIEDFVPQAKLPGTAESSEHAKVTAIPIKHPIEHPIERVS